MSTAVQDLLAISQTVAQEERDHRRRVRAESGSTDEAPTNRVIATFFVPARRRVPPPIDRADAARQIAEWKAAIDPIEARMRVDQTELPAVRERVRAANAALAEAVAAVAPADRRLAEARVPHILTGVDQAAVAAAEDAVAEAERCVLRADTELRTAKAARHALTRRLAEDAKSAALLRSLVRKLERRVARDAEQESIDRRGLVQRSVDRARSIVAAVTDARESRRDARRRERDAATGAA